MLLLERARGRAEAIGVLTLDEYLTLPEDTRCEIVDGVVRPMARPDRRSRAVRRWLAEALCLARPSWLQEAVEEVVVLRTDPPVARIPDVVLVRRDADPAGETNHTFAPDVRLVVEVVSPDTETADRDEKPAEYARYGIPGVLADRAGAVDRGARLPAGQRGVPGRGRLHPRRPDQGPDPGMALDRGERPTRRLRLTRPVPSAKRNHLPM